jgi:hypothetical protein
MTILSLIFIHQTSLLLFRSELEESHVRTIKDHLSKLKYFCISLVSLPSHSITVFDLLLLSVDTPQQKKSHKGGNVVRTEPDDMHLFDDEPMIREVFQRVGFLAFFQNMQRGHPELARKFALNFDGTKTKVGTIELEVSETIIAATTQIPKTGERWFKCMTLNASFYKDFLKPNYQKDNFSKGVPSSHLVEGFDKMLNII